MALHIDEDVFIDQIYQFEETDVVQGGPDGIDNRPLKELANRTRYLLGRIGSFSRLQGERLITGSYTVAVDDVGKEIVINIANGGTPVITLLPINDYPPNAVVKISSYMAGATGVCTVVSTGGEGFADLLSPGGKRSNAYLHDREHIWLHASETGIWRVLDVSDSYYMAGEETKSRKLHRNTIIPNGAILSRTLYPRLWEFVQSLIFGQEVTTESAWLSGISGNIHYYRGLYTTGNGSTTFRIPDERGMFERMIDLGRGIDISRGHNYAGGLELDALKSHSHTYRDRYHAENSTAIGGAGNKEWMSAGYNGGMGSRNSDWDNNMFGFIDSITGTVGGNENLVKNIGKLNLIRF